MEIVSQRYSSAALGEVFGYEPDWPVLSASRRAAVEALIGPPAAPPPPGPAAGEQAGFPGVRPLAAAMDLRGAGEAGP